MAFWSANGQTHRLARGAWLVAILGMLAYLASSIVVESFGEMLAFFSVHASILIFVAVLSNLTRWYVSDYRKSGTSTGRWQIAIIELFGWTIIVAVASFGGRYMEFSFFRGNAIAIAMVIMTVMLAVPVAITLVVKNDLRDLNRFTSLLLVAVFCGAGFFGAQLSEQFFWGIVAQTFYLLLWFFVRGLDRGALGASVTEEPTE